MLIWLCVQLYLHGTHKLAHNMFLVIPMGPISLGCYRFGPHKKQIPAILFQFFIYPSRSHQTTPILSPPPKSYVSHPEFLKSFPNPPKPLRYSYLSAVRSETVLIWFCVQLSGVSVFTCICMPCRAKMCVSRYPYNSSYAARSITLIFRTERTNIVSTRTT